MLKRFLAFLMALVCVFGIISVSYAETNSNQPYDFDGSSTLTTADVILLLRYIDGLEDGYILNWEEADVSGDGKISVFDAVRLLQILLGIEIEEPEVPEVPDPEVSLKVISYNVRYCNDGEGHMIADRAPRLKKVVEDRDPDVMGFQEATENWIENYLISSFRDEYDYVFQYRAEYSKEATPIFWKKDKFDLADSGYFWLSETPDVESKGWDSKHPRICSWVKLKEKVTGKEFLYFNTHFDTSDEAHMGSAELIVQRAKAMGGFTEYPVFLTGDFNMEQGAPGYNTMLESGDFGDINKDLEDLYYKTMGGYHDDGHQGLQSGSPIDFCFYSPALIEAVDYQIIDEYLLDGWVSDHKGLYMEMVLFSQGNNGGTVPEEPEEPEVPEQPEQPEEPEEPEEPTGDPNAEVLLKVVSYNVRYANDGGEKSIENRAVRLKTLLSEYDPDVMGFQEVVPKWTDNLILAFGDEYDYSLKYRSESSKEGTPIFWKRDKFTLADSGHFWLSETPDVESKGWGESHYRIISWVKLREKTTGKAFFYFNTHYGSSDEAHVGSAELIYQRAKSMGGFTEYPVIFSGDCNMDPGSAGYEALVENFVDVNDYLGFDETYTNGGYQENGGTRIIDYIMCSPDLITPKHYEVMPHMVSGGFISDKKGLYTELLLTSAQ